MGETQTDGVHECSQKENDQDQTSSVLATLVDFCEVQWWTRQL